MPLRGTVLIRRCCLAAVADRAPGRIDASGQRRLRDDPAVPDTGDEIVLADDSLAVLDQVVQEIEDLRSKRNQISPTTQLAPIRIERIVFEQIAQFAAPSGCTCQQANLTHSTWRGIKPAVRKKKPLIKRACGRPAIVSSVERQQSCTRLRRQIMQQSSEPATGRSPRWASPDERRRLGARILEVLTPAAGSGIVEIPGCPAPNAWARQPWHTQHTIQALTRRQLRRRWASGIPRGHPAQSAEQLRVAMCR